MVMQLTAHMTREEKRDTILANLLSLYTFVFTVDKTLWVFNKTEGIYEPKAEMLVKTEIEKAMGFEYRKDDYFEILDRIQAQTYRNGLLNPNEHMICLDNGVLDLQYFLDDNAKEQIGNPLKAWDSRFELITKIPITYDSNAQCPLIDKFLHEVLKSEQDVLAIYELFGYHLLKTQKMQKASLWIGMGKNGKTVMANLLKAFIGKENLSNLTLEHICNNRFASSELYGKLANIGSELTSATLRDIEMFKKLVGEDQISSERKFKDFFQFTNYAKLTFYGNKLPIPKDLDSEYAFFRRFLIFEFPNVFDGEKDDINLIDKLTFETELSGLLNKALEGLNRLLKNGKFSNEQAWESVKETYLVLSDIERAFIDLEIESLEDVFETTENVYEVYKEFCKKHDKQPCTKNTLTIRIQQYTTARIEFRKQNEKSVRVYSGIRLKTSIPKNRTT